MAGWAACIGGRLELRLLCAASSCLQRRFADVRPVEDWEITNINKEAGADLLTCNLVYERDLVSTW